MGLMDKIRAQTAASEPEERSVPFSKNLLKIVSEIREDEERMSPKSEKGEKGDRGDRGESGRDGLDGRDGKDGKDGKDGRDGAPAKSPKRIRVEVERDNRDRVSVYIITPEY
jgi:hypothetical protein